MAKLSKRVKAFRERVDANKSYPLDEAIAILKETATAKFNESVEVMYLFTSVLTGRQFKPRPKQFC